MAFQYYVLYRRARLHTRARRHWVENAFEM